ncbi:MBL fold metallo-hydrolase [Flexithrix dorotheae]|uniref:MBL fold metallo-hydrolase n=1 Tax=Flexithrix dorotheae TaxID=70993 RepID=UPI0003792C90|nr:MBL fold metallo-hydrolase [Flexithrix dorotheae]
MKINLALLLLFLSSVTFGQQQATPDQIKTTKGDLVVQPITHGTVAFTWNKLTIFVDPYGGSAGFEGLNDPDIVLITDIHGDHLDVKTLNDLNISKAKLIVPQAVMEKLPEELKSQASVLNNGENQDVSGINIAAIPMYNLPEDATSRHTKGRGNGYILTMGGKKVYLSGDTEDIPEMRNLKNIDVAFVCMNLPYTMDINQAASAVLDFKPGIVYPYHYRGQGGLSDVEGFKKLVNDGNPKIEVRLKNWYPNQ